MALLRRGRPPRLRRRDGLPAGAAGEDRARRGGRARRHRLRLPGRARARTRPTPTSPRARFDWEVDPAGVTAAPDVVNAITALLRSIAKPGDRVVINTPVYHPFFSVIEELGCEVAEAPLVDGELDVDAGRPRVPRRRRRAGPLQPPQPDRDDADRRPAEGARRVGGRARRLGAERRDPLAADPARRPPRPLPRRLRRRRASTAIALVSASKAFNLAGLHCAQFVTASERAQELVEALPFIAKHAGHFGALASVAAYRDGAALARGRDRGDRPQPGAARRSAGGQAPRGRLHAAARRLPHLARPARAATSATTPAKRCSSAAASPSTRGRPSARRAKASRGSTSAPARRWSKRRSNGSERQWDDERDGVDGGTTVEEFEIEPIEVEARRWLDALEAETGPLSLFDTHTHFGRHDPDEFRQEPEQLIATMEYAGARAITFPMHEPDGYPAANDEARAIEAGADGRIVHFCRVNPHDGALAEAERCLDLGAHGIKLHPRAEQFAMSEAAVEDLTRLAQERGVPILIHAGRGIPALGRDTLELAQRYPGAKFILAHAAVSDLAWLWRLMPENPNLFIDTSWWNPADFVALFSLVPPGQLLWASDNPYGYPLHAAAFQLRYGAAGRAARRPDPLDRGRPDRPASWPARSPPTSARPPARPGPQDPGMERVVSHLTTAMGRAMAEGDPSESIALGRLAVDLDGPEAESGRAILRLLDLADQHAGPAAPRPPLPPLGAVRDVGARGGADPRHRVTVGGLRDLATIGVYGSDLESLPRDAARGRGRPAPRPAPAARRARRRVRLGEREADRSRAARRGDRLPAPARTGADHLDARSPVRGRRGERRGQAVADRALPGLRRALHRGDPRPRRPRPTRPLHRPLHPGPLLRRARGGGLPPLPGRRPPRPRLRLPHRQPAADDLRA